MELWVERLTVDHRIAEFSCGKKPLDEWLTRHALDNMARHLSAVYVLADGRDVVGYYSLTMSGASRAELHPKLARGLPLSVDIGAVLLGRLAVDLRWQGQHIGRGLLREAVERAAHGGVEIAARFLAVDPIDDEARAWYARQGFRDIQGAGRMYVRMTDVLRALSDD